MLPAHSIQGVKHRVCPLLGSVQAWVVYHSTCTTLLLSTVYPQAKWAGMLQSLHCGTSLVLSQR